MVPVWGAGSAKANQELPTEEAYLVEPTKGGYQIEKRLLQVAISLRTCEEQTKNIIRV